MQKKISEYFLISGLLILAASLPLSKAGMSISQAFLAFGWLISGSFSEKINRIIHNKSAIAVLSYYFLLIFGLIYSSDFAYALDDLRIKLPLFVIPFILFSMNPLEPKQSRWVLLTYVLAVFAGTLINYLVLIGWIGNGISDIRHASIFISHIRFSLMICLSICISIWFALQDTFRFPYKTSLFFLLIVWFLFFMVMVESVTGLSIMLLLTPIILGYFIYHSNNRLIKYSGISVGLLIILSSASYLIYEFRIGFKEHQVDEGKLELFSRQGNRYDHRPSMKVYENENAIWMYVCRDELKNEWNNRSNIDFDSLDYKGQYVEYTLMRFLTSKGLRKDAEGVLALSATEIAAVERGVANVNYQDISNIRQRLSQIVWELKNFANGGDPSGHSVSQRLEFWKTSTLLIQENLFTGVGTGDVKLALKEQYNKMQSKLRDDKRLKSHNQFLLTGVAFGIPGLLLFLYSLFFPLYNNRKTIHVLYVAFLFILVVSMFTEDTLETQPGATLFAFFNAFFLWAFRKTESSSGI